jgi:DNA polymerase III psi subunit
VIVKPVKHGEVDCKISGKHGMIVPPRIQVKSTERVVKFDDGTTSVVNTVMLVLAPIRLQHMQVFKAAASDSSFWHGKNLALAQMAQAILAGNNYTSIDQLAKHKASAWHNLLPVYLKRGILKQGEFDKLNASGLETLKRSSIAMLKRYDKEHSGTES